MPERGEPADIDRSLKALIREESLAAMGLELGEGALSGLALDLGPQGVAQVL